MLRGRGRPLNQDEKLPVVGRDEMEASIPAAAKAKEARPRSRGRGRAWSIKGTRGIGGLTGRMVSPEVNF